MVQSPAYSVIASLDVAFVFVSFVSFASFDDFASLDDSLSTFVFIVDSKIIK